MKALYKDKQIMLISILYRLASLLMMLMMINSGTLYSQLHTFDMMSILLLTIASLISMFIYSQVMNNQKVIRVAVYMESLLLFLIYLLTGGLYSPIIWIISVPAMFYLFHLKGKIYILIYSFLFIICTLVGPYIIGETINETSFIYLPSFFMSVTLMVFIALLAKQFQSNRAGFLKLKEAQEYNIQLNEWLNNSYSLIENLLASNDEKASVNKIFGYSAIAIPAYGFYLYKSKRGDCCYYSSSEIRHIIESQDQNYKSVEYAVEGVINYAVFGIVFSKYEEKILRDNSNKIELILKITALFFEREELIIENESLLIANEQRRIAEEMHDGINQDIHGMTYMLYDIINNHEKYTMSEVIEKLQLTYDTVKMAGHSIKKTIFHLSNTEIINNWQEGISGLTTRIKDQYDITIDLNFSEGADEIKKIGPTLFDALKRIMKESVTNAVIHGKARRVKIEFTKNNKHLCLKISDDGEGFNCVSSDVSGLGIKNMKMLAERHLGEFNIVKDRDGSCLEMSFVYET